MSPRKPKSNLEEKISSTDEKTTAQKEEAKKPRYVEAVGRRKTAVARVRIFPQKNESEDGINMIVNEKKLEEYFTYKEDQMVAKAPFKALSIKGYGVTVKVKGSGTKAQAEAVRLGVARALVKLNPLWKPPLKSLGYLKRDPRMVERKKYGMRKARRPQQWRKR